ncbi:MAG: hypothetical protein Kow00108_16220 [Calditrichia bacterium]
MKTNVNKNHWLIFVLFYLSLPVFLNGQPVNIPDTLSAKSTYKPIKIKGELGTYGELYSISGRQRRRPPSTGRIYFRPVITFFERYSIPFEFLISTEGSSARQGINQYALHPSWSWGDAHLGDFSEKYSEYSLSGIQIRGAGVNLRPGKFRFSFLAGLTQRTVSGNAGNQAYKRRIIAGKIGVGAEDKSHLYLTTLHLKDSYDSNTQAEASITVLEPNGYDQWPVGTLRTIRWLSTQPTGLVNIELSTDGGITWTTIIANTPDNGTAEWLVSALETATALIRVVSTDDSTVSDRSDTYFTIGTGIPYLKGDILPRIGNTSAITPRENLVVSVNWKMNFFSSAFVFEGEAGGSIYTRDLRSTKINTDSLEFPSLITNLITPRTGTNADFMVRSGLKINLKSVKARVDYKYIGPGYTSLGLPYLQNDQQIISTKVSYRINTTYIYGDFSHMNDNLSHQKTATGTRDRFSAGLSGQLTSFWNTNLALSAFNSESRQLNDSAAVTYSNLMFSTSNIFLVGRNKLLRNINVTYIYQGAGNNNSTLAGQKSYTHSINTGLLLGFSETISTGLNIGIIASRSGGTNSTVRQYGVGFQQQMLHGKLNNSLNFNYTDYSNNDNFRISLISSWRINPVNQISLNLTRNKFKSGQQSTTEPEFTEWTASVQYRYWF